MISNSLLILRLETAQYHEWSATTGVFTRALRNNDSRIRLIPWWIPCLQGIQGENWFVVNCDTTNANHRATSSRRSGAPGRVRRGARTSSSSQLAYIMETNGMNNWDARWFDIFSLTSLTQSGLSHKGFGYRLSFLTLRGFRVERSVWL